jgi:predicted short-subunit dehydrogenase-like oxidoreductase (DUF2520 family)
MRELERDFTSTPPAPVSLAIVGQGRLGNALTRAFPEAGIPVAGPLGRGDEIPRADAVLLCVPDAEIPRVAARVPAGSLVGHCSGATRLDALSPHEGFSLHPLMTVTARGASFAGAGAAIAGTTPQARRFAAGLASALGMVAVEVAEDDRVRYHAAASIASNFLVTLEAAAERLAAGVGVERHLLVPLVRAAVENWAQLGDEALTGPVARGDEATVAAQRSAVAEAAPDLLALFDALVAATRTHAARLREPERQAA